MGPRGLCDPVCEALTQETPRSLSHPPQSLPGRVACVRAWVGVGDLDPISLLGALSLVPLLIALLSLSPCRTPSCTCWPAEEHPMEGEWGLWLTEWRISCVGSCVRGYRWPPKGSLPCPCPCPGKDVWAPSWRPRPHLWPSPSLLGCQAEGRPCTARLQRQSAHWPCFFLRAETGWERRDGAGGF